MVGVVVVIVEVAAEQPTKTFSMTPLLSPIFDFHLHFLLHTLP